MEQFKDLFSFQYRKAASCLLPDVYFEYGCKFPVSSFQRWFFRFKH